MTLTMGQQLAVRRIRCKDPFAKAADIAMKIHASTRDVEVAMHQREPHAPVFRGPKPKVARPPGKVSHHLPGGDRKAAGIKEEPKMRVPETVLVERERRLAMSPPTLTAALLGDPLPGRSALDKRQGA